MKKAPRNSAAFVMIALLFLGCGGKEDSATRGQGDGVREAVKDVVTKDFKLYEGAKQSLKESEKRLQEQAEQIEKELK